MAFLSRRSLLRAALAPAVAALYLGCGDSTGPDSVSGTYSLQTVNGTPLPVTIYNAADGNLKISAGVLQLTNDERFTGAITYLITRPGSAPTTDPFNLRGTFSRNGSKIEFSSDSASDFDNFTGTVSGNRLTLTIDVDYASGDDQAVFAR